MRVSSAQPPLAVDVKVSGEVAWIILAENIVEIVGEPPQYQYDEYRLSTHNRNNLKESVEKNLALWLDKAKAEDARKKAPVIDEQLELDKAIDAATTIAGLKSALLGKNSLAKVKAEKK